MHCYCAQAKAAELAKAGGAADGSSARAAAAIDAASELYTAVLPAFEAAGCHQQPDTILSAAAAERGVSEKNVMVYLGMLEARLAELLQVRSDPESN